MPPAAKSGRRLRLGGFILLTLLVFGRGEARADEFGFFLADRQSVAGERIVSMELASLSPPSFLVAAGDQVLLISISAEGKIGAVRRFAESRDEINALAVHRPSARMALASDSGHVAIYELERARQVSDLGRIHRKGATGVAFTSDGRYLVTGGRRGGLQLFTADGDAIGELEEPGMGHEQRILHLFPLPGSRHLLSVGADRKVILWDLDTRRALRPTLMDMDIRSAALGGDGTLALGLQKLRGNLHRGSGMVRARETRVTDTVRLLDPQSGARGLELEGMTQDLDSVAVTPDGRFVAVAGSKALVSIFDTATGRIVTEMPSGEPASALAVSADGRWFAVGDREGSLTLFQLSGVAPAPHGVGTDAPAPIVVVLVEPTFLISAERAAGQVPVVGRPSLEIRGRIRSEVPLKTLQVAGQDITAITPVDDDLKFTAFVPLPEPGRREIHIVAENLAGARWQDRFVVERATSIEKRVEGPGSRRALLVGVSRYADSSINLEFAARDANAIYDFLVSPERGPARFEKDDVLLLVDEEATVSNINRGLREFLRQARENDFVLVFFAGHGMPDPNQLSDFYLLAHDTKPDHVAGTGIPMHHVREALAQIRSRDVLILTDSCHSAGIAAPRGMRSLRSNPIHESFLEKMRHSSGGLAILTASEAAQYSLEGPEWGGHGVFSYFLLKGLRGAADRDGDRIVALGELMEYVRREVMSATDEKQVPAIGPTSFDRQFPLVPVTGGGR